MQSQLLFSLIAVTFLCLSATAFIFEDYSNALARTNNTRLARGLKSTQTPTIKWTISKMGIALDRNRKVAAADRKEVFTFILKSSVPKSAPLSYTVEIPKAKQIASHLSPQMSFNRPPEYAVVVPNILSMRQKYMSMNRELMAIDPLKEMKFESRSKNDEMVIKITLYIKIRKQTAQDA